MNIIELEAIQRESGDWVVGCKVGRMYITASDNTLSKAIGHLKDRISAMTRMEYGIDYTFQDKMV